MPAKPKPPVVVIPPKFVGKPAGYPQDLPPAQVRARFRKLLGEFRTPSVPLRLKVVGPDRLLPGGIVQQRVEYDVAPGERVAALHLFRKGLPTDAPGVLSIHGHGGEGIFPHGKTFHAHPKPDEPIQYSYHAARAGFRVLAPDALCFGERQARWGYAARFFDEIGAHEELVARGLSLGWKSVWDNARAIDALTRLGASSVGAIGWSGGSMQGYLLAAADERVKATVCYCSFLTIRHQHYQYRLCHCLYLYLPGMVSAGIDWDQVVALVAPRKLFFGWGGKDEGSPRVMYRAFVDAIRARCRKEGLPPSVFTFEEPEIGHGITPPMLAASLDFLRRELDGGR